ncbi:UvrD/REP helicase N-terminal domain-containing protein [Actinomadura meyerae]|uniref:DNA 3'-5' helicase n=1 Tax=Actinomadura meyerae TaxID=240840 RepID=A0A239NU67_9ACTN|nr:UvrD-helicase domain-containing protein [Actinomadura meyerae]SNT58406.1 UvrD/REP helicase N-terminal domain-containing protein [Actinomadura meyerae]
MPQLAIAKEFLAEYASLEKPVRRAVQDAIDKFAHHTHASLHLEKLHGGADPRIRTIRIDRFWRGVVLAPEDGDIYCLLRVLPHDDAIAYATSRRFTVNQVLGVLEVRDEKQLRTMSETLETVAGAAPAPRLFDHVKDSQLRWLGIDDQVLPIVRLLTREAHLDALQHLLPELQYDALVALASGMTPEETWDAIAKNLVDAERPKAVEPDDLPAAIERTPAQVALVDGPEELAKILRPPFALWRIFLHPSQRRIAYRDSYPGSVMITGGAGTGKTVTALHRAAHLARRYGDGVPILMTTYSKPLTAELGRQLDQLIEDPRERERIEVLTTDQLAARSLRERLGRSADVIGYPELCQFADRLNLHPDRSGKFLVDEWEGVLLAQNITDYPTYEAARRTGRGESLHPSKRPAVWAAIEALRDRLRADGLRSFLQIADEAAGILRESGEPPYRHVIVDEAQDLHPAQWRLLRAAVPVGPDDLFLVGDPHQRIWQHRVSMRDTGVHIVGRTQRLTVSYRTTQEILDWAVRVLGLAPADELDDWPDSLDGYESPMHGRRPIVRRFPSWDEEREAAVRQVRSWLADGVEPGAIAVTARVNTKVKDVASRLGSLGIQTEPPTGPGRHVRIGAMHSLKGLEFQCVAVVGVQEGLVPHPKALVPPEVDKASHRESLQRERCVLYVACTRARDRLYASYSGPPSPFLPR